MSSDHPAKRQPCGFSDKIEKRLADYLLAAGAAGVGVLALAQAAGAKIVYTSTSQLVTHGFVPIDLNHDGQIDFELRATSTISAGRLISASGFNFKSDFVAQPFSYGSFAVRFNSGSLIGGNNSKFTFARRASLMTYALSNGEGSRGLWVNAHGYLGLRIKIDGQWHYGWARIKVHRTSALLTGYAYETIANKPIKAGQTSGDSESGAELHSQGSLGALALGAPGLALWRREDSAADTPSA